MAADVTTQTGLHRVLRLRYKACWDAYKAIAHENAELFSSGQKPPDERLQAEKEAAAAVQQARHELLAAIARVGA